MRVTCHSEIDGCGKQLCTMKLLIVFGLCVLSVVCKETYTTENDNFDIDSVVADPPTLKKFADCFNDKAECEDVMKDFKKDIKEAVEQSCDKCTDAQKYIFKRFLEGLKEKLPADYEAFKNKYDPQSAHFSALEAAIANAKP